MISISPELIGTCVGCVVAISVGAVVGVKKYFGNGKKSCTNGKCPDSACQKNVITMGVHLTSLLASAERSDTKLDTLLSTVSKLEGKVCACSKHEN